MGCIFWLPSSGSAPVSPTPSSSDWTLHINNVSRPMNFINGGSAITALTYAPDAADHLVDGSSMCAQFVSPILPPQTIGAQVIAVGARTAENVATNNLNEAWTLYAVNVAGTTKLATLVTYFKSAIGEIATAATGYLEGRTSSAVTLNEPFRLVLEVGASGLPTNTGTDTHNHTWTFGEVFAAGALNLAQNDDTTSVPATLIFEDGIVMGPLGEASLAIGI
jgi:hypothetical protein